VISREHLIAYLSAAFGALAALLAAVGLYGVMAYAMSRRTGEIGIRMALGARPSDIRWLALSESLRLIGAGVIVGVARRWLPVPWCRDCFSASRGPIHGYSAWRL